ncbi:MAG: hypothetical protein MJ239_07205 [Bacilli bacterium]|nr:hypothetical protein [Bacilli bacterium]
MLKTYSLLIEELSDYKNPKTKIQRMVEAKELFPIAKGLYETDPNTNPFYLADPLYSPSYISFETALSYYGLIPERVFAVKCASFRKRKHKRYDTDFGLYMYQDIPESAFPFEIFNVSENGYTMRIAGKEKALLDTIYSSSPTVKNIKELKSLIFDDLRINEALLETLDKRKISDLAPLYHSKNVEIFVEALLGEKLHD